MTAVSISASTLVNACGVGWREVQGAVHGGAGGLRRNDFEPAVALDTFIGRVGALESHRLPRAFEVYDCRNNRLAHLCLEQDAFIAAVDGACERYGAHRLGVFVGTSTSGMLSSELAYRAKAPLSPQLYRDCHSMYAITRFVRAYLKLTGPAMTVSTACSSSAKVFATAARMIDAGFCDAAVVGGVDSLALSTLYGFHSLELLSRNACRPFAADRDGISLGEAAGFALLDRTGDGAVALVGAGESCDAYHMSSPHPKGEGAAQAMRNALGAAGLDARELGYINLHGTASRANDAAEDCAIVDVFGTTTPASSTKGFTGHALGAAGITEALITMMALIDQWLPGTLNCTRIDPSLRSSLITQSKPHAFRYALTNSFGFGGNNCSLVLGLTA